MLIAALSNASWLRLATMMCSTIMVITAGCVAASAVGNENRRWWAVIGTLLIAAMIVYVGYSLFRSGYYISYDPA